MSSPAAVNHSGQKTLDNSAIADVIRIGTRGEALTPLQLGLLSLAFIALYVLSAKAGLSFASLQPNATAVWPPTGLAIGATLLFGARLAPAVFLGAFLANVSGDTGFFTSVSVAAGNTLEAVVAAYLTLRLGRSRDFLARQAGFEAFVLGAVVIATAISATIGVGVLTLAGNSSPELFYAVWLTWWVGDVVGALIVAPLVFAWGMPKPAQTEARAGRYAEAVLTGFVCLAAAWVAFWGALPYPQERAPIGFICLPPLIWAAFRLSQRGTAVCLFLVAVVAVWATARGQGPFSAYPIATALVLLQGFVAVVALSALALSVTIRERVGALAALSRAHEDLERRVAKRTAELQSANQALEESQAKWRALTESSPDHTILIDTNARILSINHLLPGYTMEQVIGSDALSYVAPEYHQVMRDCFDRVIATGAPDYYEVEYRRDDTVINYETAVGLVKSGDSIIGLTMSARDVTHHRRALRDVENLNDQISLLLESTGDGIFGVDKELKCTFVNRAAAAMLGYRSEDVLGKDMHALIHNRHEDGTLRSRSDSTLCRTISERRSFTVDEDVLWSKSGEAIPVQYTANPIVEEGDTQGAVVIFRNIAEARAVARKMDFLATHDALTGLVNRREFEHRLRRVIDLARNEGSQHVVCYLDMDQFKVVNDTCGHAAGDELLRQLTLILFRKIRQGDTLARLGGDEFGVLITHCGLQDGMRVISDIRQAVADFRFVWEGKAFAVAVSIGVTVLDTQSASVGDVLSEADTACFMAKDAGRNRIHVYQADDADIARRRGELQWVSRLHESLARGSFSLYAQPIYALADGSLSANARHYEILLRMRDSEHGEIPPGAFIPAAERYDIMTQVDRWVVSATLEWLAGNKESASHVACWTINLSGQSLGDAAFLGFVLEQLRQSKVDPARLCFEVTETAAVANLQGAVRFMNALKQEGCAFALDDFGSGMSSLAYLKNLPVDYLKIDGNFVRDVADDPIDRAMIEAVTRIAKVMNIKTVAEFVENDTILRQVAQIGVDCGQGFALGKPQPLQRIVGQALKPVA